MIKFNKGQLDLVHIIVGIILIIGGILYIFVPNQLGLVIAGLGVFIELIINFAKDTFK